MAIGSGFFQKARRALSLAQYSELLQSIRLLNRGQHEPRAVPGGSRRDVGPPWEGGLALPALGPRELQPHRARPAGTARAPDGRAFEVP
ncbi:unnamed protein product, partial [Prorocentrum cordatum]